MNKCPVCEKKPKTKAKFCSRVCNRVDYYRYSGETFEEARERLKKKRVVVR